MTLRTTSIRRQRQAWACLAFLGVIAYFVLVPVLGLGNPFRFFGPHQMRVLLPLVVLLRLLAREFRWDRVKREEKAEKVEVEGQGQRGEKAGGESRWRAEERSDSAERPVDATRIEAEGRHGLNAVKSASSRQKTEESPVLSPTPTQNSNFSAAPAAEASALWERARVMVRNVIPDPVADAEYLNLVFSAAERGCVPALAKLGEYAFRRGAFVEAYFWTKIAKRRLEMENGANPQGVREIDEMLRNIRRAWTAAGQPPEFENVYDEFPEERGELGRAFLRLDSGIEVVPTRKYVRVLAENGNPDAALFVEKRTGA